MKRSTVVKSVVGILCILILITAAVVALILDANPFFDFFNPGTQPQDPTDPGSSSSVTIPPETNADGQILGIRFPCTFQEYGLVLEKLDSYDGTYVEDGSNAKVEGIAMLMIRNTGSEPVEFAQILVKYPQGNLLFEVSALPAGARMVVQEGNGKAMPKGSPLSASATVVLRDEMDMSEDTVKVTDNGNNTLTIRNLSRDTLPTVRVFYKYYMEDEDIFVGGIAFTVRITRLAPGDSITVQPSHYTSKTSRVVMVTTYDSEV